MTVNIKPIFATVLVMSIALSFYSAQAYAQSPQVTLKQYISDLQKSPNDNVLREKIIKHVQTMKQKPAVPEDAKKYMVRGKAAFKGAKEAKDFNDAADEFNKALLSAPWLAEGYYNLGIVQDRAGRYAVAMESLKLYVIAAPNALDVEKVKELIYEIEYRKEKATKESSPEAVALREQQKSDNWLKKLDGRRYANPERDQGRTWVIDVRGKVLVAGISGSGGGYVKQFSVECQGRETTTQWVGHEETLIISEDGNSITRRTRYSDGEVNGSIYLWQR